MLKLMKSPEFLQARNTKYNMGNFDKLNQILMLIITFVFTLIPFLVEVWSPLAKAR